MPASGLRPRLEQVRGRSDVRVREVAKAVLNYHGQRKAILRRFLFDAISPFTPAVAVERNGITYFVSTTDKVVGRDAFGSGAYGQGELGHTVRILEAHLGRPLLQGKTFMDVGANIGTTVIPAVRHYGAAYGIAVEPEPANFRLLLCNLIANELTDRVQCHRVAFSDRSGTGLLELSSFNSGDHRVRVADQNVLFDGDTDGGRISITLTSLDDFLLAERVTIADIGLVWIDAQGHEAQILAGASILTSSDVPVVIEYWPHGLRLAGGLERLNQLVATRYRTIVDLRASVATGRSVVLSPAALPQLASRLRPGNFTDLILMR
jgi:FkbM family methyltransferase